MQTAYEIGFDTCWIHQERKMFEMGAGQQLLRDMDVQQQAFGTDFLEKYKAVIDYPHSKLYLIIEPSQMERIKCTIDHINQPGGP